MFLFFKLYRSILKAVLLVTLSVAATRALPVGFDESSFNRETKVTNGAPVINGQFPFLSAVLSGRKATVQIDGRAWSANYIGGGLQRNFEGQVVDCGVASSLCVNAVGKICAIAFDIHSDSKIFDSIESQISNCSAGGGIGAIFRSNGDVVSIPELSEYADIPAVYLANQFAVEAMMVALGRGGQIYTTVEGRIPDTILCGATYLGNLWVLTAAHCVISADNTGGYRVRNPEEILVNVGAYDLTTERLSAQAVSEVIIGNYQLSGPWSENDFALLRLQSVPLRGEPIGLIDRASLDALSASAAPALILGWGSQVPREPLSEPVDYATSKIPRSATLTLHTVTSCRNQWSQFFRNNNLNSSGLDIREIHVCASDPEQQQDACQGDSGGPLLVEVEGVLKLAGITSFGLGCGAADGVPGVYASVPSFSDWVALNIGHSDRIPQVQVQMDDSFLVAANTGVIDVSLLLAAVFYLLYTVVYQRID